jgi:PAN domain-containing protein
MNALLRICPVVPLVIWTSILGAQPNQMPVLQNTDRPGSAFSQKDTTSWQTCASACEVTIECRVWTFARPIKPKTNGVCRLKRVVYDVQSSNGHTSGVVNPLHQIQACRAVNKSGTGSAACIDPDGRSFGKAGTTFRSGDNVMILLRFRRLSPGSRKVVVVYAEKKGSIYQSFDGNRYEYAIHNDQPDFAFWFRAPYRDIGQWRVSVSLVGQNSVANVLGHREYCVNCALE